MEEKELQKLPEEKKSVFREIFEWILCIVVALTVAVIIKYYLFTPTLVQQRSMTPTILDGERVLINRIVRTLKLPIYRGDIITFESPSAASNDDAKAYYDEREGLMNFITYDLLEINKISFIKRVIGIAGDHVEITEDGNVYVNGTKLNETYLSGDVITPITGKFYNLIVPDGYIFVMGDNRGGSSDSREFGCIPLEKVEGRVTYRLWPLNKIGKIDK